MPILDVALQPGWNSLGTFGRTFRDITGESPREVRARQRAATHALEQVPGCFLSAAQRPDLTIAVSEKRRREAGDTRSEEHTSELQSLMRISYAVFCLKKKTTTTRTRKRINKDYQQNNNNAQKK